MRLEGCKKALEQQILIVNIATNDMAGLLFEMFFLSLKAQVGFCYCCVEGEEDED